MCYTKLGGSQAVFYRPFFGLCLLCEFFLCATLFKILFLPQQGCEQEFLSDLTWKVEEF
jgi:hypothetical protein